LPCILIFDLERLLVRRRRFHLGLCIVSYLMGFGSKEKQRCFLPVCSSRDPSGSEGRMGLVAKAPRGLLAVMAAVLILLCAYLYYRKEASAFIDEYANPAFLINSATPDGIANSPFLYLPSDLPGSMAVQSRPFGPDFQFAIGPCHDPCLDTYPSTWAHFSLVSCEKATFGVVSLPLLFRESSDRIDLAAPGTRFRTPKLCPLHALLRAGSFRSSLRGTDQWESGFMVSASLVLVIIGIASSLETD
jgi:hypothetical protein